MPILSLLMATSIATSGSFPDSAVVALVKDIGAGQDGTIFCLRIDGKDPSKALISKIRATSASFRPSSECKSKNNAIRHTPTGKRAAQIWLSDFRLTDKNRAKANISSYAGPLAGGHWSAKLKLVGGVWTVEATRNDVIY